MAIFPSSICQGFNSSYNIELNNEISEFDYNNRNRINERSFPILDIEITVKATDSLIFEDFYYDDIKGGSESFEADWQLGSLVVSEWKMVGEVKSSILVKDLYQYKFKAQAVVYEYRSVQECPLVPEEILFPNENITPC